MRISDWSSDVCSSDLQSFTTDGISAIAPAFGGGERDGYRNRSVTGRAELALAPNLSVEMRGYYSTARVDLDSTGGDTPDYALNEEFVSYAGATLDLLDGRFRNRIRSEEHTSELQSLMRISYAV